MTLLDSLVEALDRSERAPNQPFALRGSSFDAQAWGVVPIRRGEVRLRMPAPVGIVLAGHVATWITEG